MHIEDILMNSCIEDSDISLLISSLDDGNTHVLEILEDVLNIVHDDQEINRIKNKWEGIL